MFVCHTCPLLLCLHGRGLGCCTTLEATAALPQRPHTPTRTHERTPHQFTVPRRTAAGTERDKCGEKRRKVVKRKKRKRKQVQPRRCRPHRTCASFFSSPPLSSERALLRLRARVTRRLAHVRLSPSPLLGSFFLCVFSGALLAVLTTAGNACVRVYGQLGVRVCLRCKPQLYETASTPTSP